jgi:ABC-2 type transport system ATP-binding protein
MRALTDAGLLALTSQPPTLEDLFLRHYGATVPAAAAGDGRRIERRAAR